MGWFSSSTVLSFLQRGQQALDAHGVKGLPSSRPVAGFIEPGGSGPQTYASDPQQPRQLRGLPVGQALLGIALQGLLVPKGRFYTLSS